MASKIFPDVLDLQEHYQAACQAIEPLDVAPTLEIGNPPAPGVNSGMTFG